MGFTTEWMATALLYRKTKGKEKLLIPVPYSLFLFQRQYNNRNGWKGGFSNAAQNGS